MLSSGTKYCMTMFIGNPNISRFRNLPRTLVTTAKARMANRSSASSPKNVTRVLHVELERIAEIASADLVLLDVSPHDGDKEQKFFDELRRRSFEGILILDDIYWKLDKGMTSFWESITLKKIDVTAIGHYTGTGIVVFNPDKWDVEG